MILDFNEFYLRKYGKSTTPDHPFVNGCRRFGPQEADALWKRLEASQSSGECSITYNKIRIPRKKRLK